MADTIRPLFTWRSGIMRSDLPSTVKFVALALSLHMNEMGGSCYPSASRLAKECSLNPSTIWSCLKRLQEDEWLAVIEHGGQKGDKRRANVYEARVPIAQDDTSSSTYRPHRVAPIAQDNTSTSVISTTTSPVVQDNGSSTTIGKPLTDEEREEAKRRLAEARRTLPSSGVQVREATQEAQA